MDGDCGMYDDEDKVVYFCLKYFKQMTNPEYL